MLTTTTEVTGRELVDATESALRTMQADSRIDQVEVTIPLAGGRQGTYLVNRRGGVRRVA